MANRGIKFWLSLLAVIAVAGLIFFFSSQEGDASSELSGSVTRWLLSALMPGFTAMTPAEQARMLARCGLYVRKAAHFSEYALLGFTLAVFLHYAVNFRRLAVIALPAWALAAAYACSDEWHQSFVARRGPAALDVCIDSAGALAGVVLGLALIALRHRARRRNSEARYQ